MEKRRPFIAGNWKMFKTCKEAQKAALDLSALVKGNTYSDVMIAPPFTSLTTVSDAFKGTGIALGGQNLFWEEEGAFTGEISGGMLISSGCGYVLIGHSERRQFFGETDETVNRKIQAAAAAGLTPVFCVGESLETREENKTNFFLDKQIRNGLKDISFDERGNLIIAYEPIWAIGTGKTATSKQAQEVHVFIRSLMAEIYGNALADSIRILYGGSVKPDNIRELMSMPDVDGALVGGASLDPETFGKIVNFKAKN